MSPSFTFNNSLYSPVDNRDLLLAAKKRFSRSLGDFLGASSDLEIFDEIVHEYPALNTDDIRALAILWADVVAKEFTLEWYLVVVDGREQIAIATTDPLVFVIFPEYRVRECVSRAGATFHQLFTSLLFEIVLIYGTTPLSAHAAFLLRSRPEAGQAFKFVGP